jgi:hypothetical protein
MKDRKTLAGLLEDEERRGRREGQLVAFVVGMFCGATGWGVLMLVAEWLARASVAGRP